MCKDVKEIINLAVQICEENILKASAKSEVGADLACLMNSKDGWRTHRAKKGIVRNYGKGRGSHRNQVNYILKL